jgi:DNA-binding CsgD family transcriptional regulator
MTPEIARRVVSLFQRLRPPQKADWTLTPAEERLLKLMIDGESYKSAAAQMNISLSTVSFHARHIYDKLHVHSKSEAVAKALLSGFRH